MGHFFQYTAGTLFFDIVEARHFKMKARHFKVALSISGPSALCLVRVLVNEHID